MNQIEAWQIRTKETPIIFGLIEYSRIGGTQKTVALVASTDLQRADERVGCSCKKWGDEIE
jgi:hypothetical protein